MAQGAKWLCDKLGNGDPAFTPQGRDAFWHGDGDSMWDALSDRGWVFYDFEAPYLWSATAPDGSAIRFVEGDIYIQQKETV